MWPQLLVGTISTGTDTSSPRPKLHSALRRTPRFHVDRANLGFFIFFPMRRHMKQDVLRRQSGTWRLKMSDAANDLV
ncbi:unnamed protein product [Protopolystoma xenopodis]|uniref:Uncharacterized protein n=1 Tax=Protopolystoma xenopodis TaxID=117903 RepID=A0A3S5BSX8_9PLAT|nr:unnamed protein product [Protopolystoma xenopodis]